MYTSEIWTVTKVGYPNKGKYNAHEDQGQRGKPSQDY